jgi:hypothetical protein
MVTIATLYQLRQRLGLAADDTDDDTRLLHALQSASSQIERLTNRHFCPRLATIEHDMNPSQVTELLLVDDLLELTTLTNGDGSSINSDDILTIPDVDGAIAVIRLTGGTAFCWDLTPLRAVSVTGIWGWHDRWSQAWRDSADTVQDNPLSSSATSLTVNDADGADAENEAPRFQVGQLLRIESEYLRVLAVNTTTNVLTVQRGVNGTTAAAHTQTTTIEVYQPPQDVQTLTLRWAAWLYKEPDNRTFSGTPANLTRALDGLRRVGVKA